MKKINLLLAAILVATVASAQVKFSLSMLSDGKTYQVSMLPETTWESPMNTTGSVQVVVAVPGSEPFFAKKLESKIQGVTWFDETYVESPVGAAGWQFISFTIKEMGTKSIPFEAGIETPLFTFQSKKGDCKEGILLLDNNDPMVKEVVKNKFNITQNITVLGMRGNAFTGIHKSSVDCPEQLISLPETLIGKVKSSPIPAVTYVDFSWVNSDRLETLELQVCNDMGQIIKQHKLNTNPGAQVFHYETGDMAQGTYSVTFIANGKQQETLRLLVSK